MTWRALFEPFEQQVPRVGPPLRKLASVRSHEARRGVNGFGSFSRKKRTSPAGAKPGNTDENVDLRVECEYEVNSIVDEILPSPIPSAS
jgi:hypothetical protein